MVVSRHLLEFNNMSDVWKLETTEQDWASEEINFLYDEARRGGVAARNYLKKLYGDSWDTIKERMNTEGSTWYVWYMDGVNQFLQDNKK